MKSPRLAAVLSFIVPGAGLWYLGQRFWGAMNLLGATAMVVLLSRDPQGLEQIHYVFLAVAAGSAGLAHAMTTEHNDLLRIAQDRHSRLGENSCDCTESEAVDSDANSSSVSTHDMQRSRSDEHDAVERFPAVDLPTWRPVARS